MGDDFSTLQVFAGSSSVASRENLISVVRESLSASGFLEIFTKDEFHNRVVVIGPTENTPWLTVYDSSCSYDNNNRFKLLFSFSAFTEFVKAISANFGPSVIISMDDSCSVAFELFVDGQSVDRYQDNPTIGHLVKAGKWSEAERKINAGHPEIWVKHLGLEDEMANTLRRAWTTDGYRVSSPMILKNTAKVLGWNEHLCRTGYNIGADGISYPYQMITSNYAGYPENEFTELYFAQSEKSS
jgi:hypothetical protein